ncbi:hypothetical protein ACFL4V_00190 [Candidatus Latescibacterota bacterium]
MQVSVTDFSGAVLKVQYALFERLRSIIVGHFSERAFAKHRRHMVEQCPC